MDSIQSNELSSLIINQPIFPPGLPSLNEIFSQMNLSAEPVGVSFYLKAKYGKNISDDLENLGVEI